MADEKSTNQNLENEPEQGKAMGAAANTAAQGQQGQQTSESQPSEISGQGGGIQGSGQRQPNPGGYTEGGDRDRDESRDNQSSTERRPDPTQGE